MKDFSRAGGRLRTLPFQARLVYSVFLGFTLIALAFSAWLGAEMVGKDLAGARTYYAGGADPSQAAPKLPSADGPVLEVPDDALPTSASDPMPLRKLLEVTHFHLFSMPVYLMVLSHLFMLSSLGARTKTTIIALASVAVALHIAAPWILRSATPMGTFVYGLSGALLTLTFLAMSFVPLWEMWRPRKSDPTA